jgi:signal transduction histidine kinase/DNA-binding response OmpR family regulator
VAWAVLVGTLLLGARGVDGEGHARTTTDLLGLRAQLLAFDQRLQRARLGDDSADEGLPHAFAKLELEAASLPSRVEFGRRGEAGSALAAYMDALRSVRTNVGRVSALAALLRLEGLSTDPHELEVVRSSLDEELAAIADHDLFGACDSVLTNYAGSFGEELEEAEIYRIGLYLLTAILLARLMQSMRESQARAAELRTANRTLEDRVEERTRTLSATNRALESAIAEARRAELDARSAREAAETANRTKSSFLANMSHEIRTPMTSILGFSERLLDDEISNTDRADAIATIRRNGEHLTQLVSDILDLSKIEAGRLSLELVSTPLLRIATDMRDAMAPRAQEKGLEFVIEWKGALPEMVLTDPLRLEQVLFNLVGNAIKFTDCGRIVARIGYESPKDGTGVGRLQFDIEDSGIGMDEETIHRLFRPFVQGDSSTTRRFGGTGLGLSICSHLVGRLGGSFHVTSEVGRGSVFSFDVEAGPLEGALLDPEVVAGAPPPSVPAAPPRLSGMRVLLAEDGEDNRRLLRHLLTSAGASVSLAVDGEDAVHLALAARAHDRAFDVVLMDMQMPRLDGYEATRRLREAGYEQPIVALTANAMAPDRERCLSAGCDDYCAKPVRRADLLETVFRWRKAGSEEEPDMALQSNRRLETDQDEGLMELVRTFVEDLAQDMSSMRAALAAQDIERLSMLAHRLKGAAGSYGFPEITRQAAQLEGALGSGLDSTTVACELASLEAICAAARGTSES